MIELMLGILLAAGAMYFVVLPILRPPLEPDTRTAVDEGDDPADDMSAQAVALRALKEIEFDRATGKLSDTDYDALKAKYTAEALAAMRGDRAPSAASGAPEILGAPRTAHSARCPEHGTRPERDAAFCSDCGRRLGTAPGYCARCGTALETDANYCNTCGARVAA